MDSEEFNYGSDPEYDTIDFSNWNTMKVVKKLAVQKDKDENSDKDKEKGDDNEESSNNDYPDCSMNVIKQEMEVKAMSAGKKTNANNRMACKEIMRCTNQ